MKVKFDIGLKKNGNERIMIRLSTVSVTWRKKDDPFRLC